MKVVVIGGGILGASIAWHLRDKADVTVIDCGGLGGLASRASLGWLNATYYLNDEHFKLRQAGIQAWRDISTKLPNLPLQWSGTIVWDMADGKRQDMIDRLRLWDYPVEELDKNDVKALEPSLAKIPDHALHLPTEGFVSLSSAAEKLLKASGAKAYSGIPARSIDVLSDRVRGVQTDQGIIEADQIVVAAGTATEGIAASLDIKIPMLSRPGLMLRTSPAPKSLSNVCATPDFELLQRNDGRFMLPVSAGHQSAKSEYISNLPAKMAEKAMSQLLDYFPNIDLSLEEVMLAYRPVPEDELPVIGQAGPRGLNFLTMHSAATLGIIAGECLAKQMLGQDMSNLKPFHPERFAEKELHVS